MPEAGSVLKVYRQCVAAISENRLIKRESRRDKEFHFQNWFAKRLSETRLHSEEGGRNSYPDFRMVRTAEGYEVKGLAYPGREVTYDCNSQVPSGIYNGRVIFYVFGRYPAEPDGNSYPVMDLVVCHGDFLNADHEYVHENKSVRGFGSYGDIMIRDRKMYVAPTPFGLTEGTAHSQTLILPDGMPVDEDMQAVGTLRRREASTLVIGYAFDLRRRTLSVRTVPNPAAGKEHVFCAYRLRPQEGQAVRMREQPLRGDECDDDTAGE
jgi:hypothetical protein